jgi:hypothetical protein
MPIADAGAPSKGYQPIIRNFKLLANDPLGLSAAPQCADIAQSEMMENSEGQKSRRMGNTRNSWHENWPGVTQSE